jgi:ferrous iron transport protein B
VNALLAPLTAVWLGLPLALGVPLLFGVLRKELSLLMIFQALGTLDVGTALDPVQLMTLLLFLTFYVPCLSTFAVMLRALGARLALQSVAISLGAALVVAGTARVAMQWAVSLAA